MSTAAMIAVIVGAAAAGAGILYGLVRARTDWFTGSATREQAARDEVREIIGIKDEMIDALRESNNELREQTAKFISSEKAWRREREEYKRRLTAVEEGYHSVVIAVVQAGICAAAPSCANYVPPATAIRTKE